MTEIVSASRATTEGVFSRATRLVPMIAGALRAIRRSRQMRRTRKQLAELDMHLLRDIGMSAADVSREVRKSFPQMDDCRPDRAPWR